jgi:hypothetical protein
VAIEPFTLERFTPRKPWLVLGTDPSLAAYDPSLSRSHDVFALDEAMRGMRASVGHAESAAVLEGFSARELAGIEHLCMPAGTDVESSPIAKSFADRGRLLSYDPEWGSGAAAAVRLLAQSGARSIRTLGIDKGPFGEIATTLNHYDVLCGPLDWELPARVLVDTKAWQALPYRVLAYAIRRHASISVQVERLDEALERRGIAAPEPLQRLAIPELRGHRGRAIYLDAALLLRRDIRELWGMELAGHEIAGSSVALIDCESGKTVTPPSAPARYVDTTPWTDPLHPDAAVWSRYLLDAVTKEEIEEELVREEISKGNARASLLAQLEKDEADPRRLPFGVLRREVGLFKAFKTLIRGQGRN